MLSKSEKLWIKSLKDKKIRYIQKEFIAEGSRIVIDLIKSAPDKLKFLCATPEWYSNFEPVLIDNNDKIHIISADILQSVSTLKSTEEVLAIFEIPEFTEVPYMENQLIIYLDKIRDPGNLGSIIRSADWFGLSQLYCSTDCVDPFNNKCVQATMSSIMRVQLIIKSWNEMSSTFSSIEKYAATADGQSLYELNKSAINFICIGNEANGLSDEILNQCSKKISIPSIHSLGAESLNVAVACSLIMAWKTFG